MREIPCKNCVTLAICKAENSTVKVGYIVNPITLRKCCLVYEWCKTYNDGSKTSLFIRQNLEMARDYLRKNNEQNTM